MLTILILLAATLAGSQASRDVPPLEARQITGTVLDADNQPMVGARVDDADIPLHASTTDASGRFALTTRSPVLVIRKAGMRSQAVFLKDAGEIRIALGPERRKPTVELCSDRTNYETIKGFGAQLWFPRIAGVKVGPQGNDVDYGLRSYFVTTEYGMRGIRHASGPLWGSGKPDNQLVWRSVSYDELVFEIAGITITDARGETPDGKKWRQLGKFGESAFYRDVESAPAAILDKVLDAACLLPRDRR